MTDEQDPQEPPGAVSDQNGEEAEAGHEGRRYGRRRPRPVESEEERSEGDGAAREGSQSTGHPESAG
jgi:hypothetical protein